MLNFCNTWKILLLIFVIAWTCAPTLMGIDFTHPFKELTPSEQTTFYVWVLIAFCGVGFVAALLTIKNKKIKSH
ncbi:MAG: hypothetical protein Q8P20_03380 [bacterium]|nr:hypothetical protein [bacterium]